MKTKKSNIFNKTDKIVTAVMLFFITVSSAQVITVSTLAVLRSAVKESDKEIVLAPGDYYLEDLPSTARIIDCSGSRNTIDLSEARIHTLVGSIREVYFIVSGDDNIIKNGAIEDYYASGLKEVKDFSAYNHDNSTLAYGLKGDPVMSITGNRNLVDGLEMIVKGSFPYGYGSQYGIGSTNTFGLSKRCGILITGSDGGGVGNTLDNIKMYHHAFGHGIYMQNDATETTIKNSYIEGRMRLSDDMYNDAETYDLPYRTDYTFPSGDDWRTLPFKESYPIPYDVMYPLSEDGIRSYSGSGSVVVENCTVKQMRGGIRLYLASSAIVSDSKAIECGATNYNMPKNGKVINSSGDFTYAPLSDFRLSRSNQTIEMTIIPSPNAIGPHNLADVLGDNHHITFHRTEGPLDSDEMRAIVVSGSNSTIVNETEYKIILEAGTSGNTITSCGEVVNEGSNNSILDCNAVPNTCGSYDPYLTIQASDFCSQSGIQEVDGKVVGYINSGDWVKYDALDFGSEASSLEVSVASSKAGGTIEVRTGSNTGPIIGKVEVSHTGSFTSWVTLQTNLTGANGSKDVYFVFTGGSGYLFDVNWFKFIPSGLGLKDGVYSSNESMMYPNPVKTFLTVDVSTDSVLKYL